MDVPSIEDIGDVPLVAGAQQADKHVKLMPAIRIDLGVECGEIGTVSQEHRGARVYAVHVCADLADL